MDKTRLQTYNDASGGDSAVQTVNVDTLMNRFSERMKEADEKRKAEEAVNQAAREEKEAKGKAELEKRLNDIDISISNITVHNNLDDDPAFGYKNRADFFVDVRHAFTTHNVTDNLKAIMNAVGSDEAAVFSNPDGGFLLPEILVGGHMKLDPFAIQGDTGLRTRQVPMGNAKTLTFNARVDKDHSDSVTGGFRVFRRAEANEVTSSKTQYEQVRLSANALSGMAFATEEQIMYSPESISAIIEAGFDDEWRSRLNNERLRGTGVGQFEGIFISDALVTVAKETSQTADTIVSENVTKMRARAYNYGQCVWMVNQDCYNSLVGMHITGTNSDQFIYVSGNGSDVPDTLLGRPIVYDENLSTLGDKGDIVLVNWNEYLEGQVGGSKFEQSIHVRFTAHETAYRFGVYNDGRPWWKSALTPKQSSTTLSPFVTLAARA